MLEGTLDPVSLGDRTILVAVGASAGGLEALRALFADVPPRTPFAFVVIQHLSPDHRSMMVELLTRHTELEVRAATQGARPQAGCIHLIQPQTILRLNADGTLDVEELDTRTNLRAIDTFMTSMATHAKERFCGIVLSGTGSDGAAGLAAIHAAGGVTAVQTPESAAFDGMPRAAMRSHEVHIVETPAQIMAELPELASHEGPIPLAGRDGEPGTAAFQDIFRHVRQQMGVDFSLYKPTTILRRLERRMSARNVENAAEYAELLGRDEQEIRRLGDELLINVTRFARDDGAIEALRQQVIPRLVERAHIDSLRLWVAGCSTGEEAYTMAMLLQDALDAEKLATSFRIFATDVAGEALQFASRGLYPKAITEHITPSWRERYFIPKGDTHLQVKQSIRDRIVFSAHNVVEDPPFTRLDMVSCRNLLIYLRVSAQERALKSMSVGLEDGGVLWLGSSETVGAMDLDFDALDRRWKIYVARSGRKRIASWTHPRTFALATKQKRSVTQRDHDVLVQGLEQAMAGYVPPMLLADHELRLVHRQGEVGRLLSVPTGPFTRDVRDMLPRELSALITTARARTLGQDDKELVYPSLHVQVRGTDHQFDLRVRCIQVPRGPTLFALFFEGLVEGEEATAIKVEASALPIEIQTQLEAYDRELRATRESLQSTIEQLESSNEELQSTNEELIASNEELQSANEELQSLNEELYTVNAEHQDRMAEMADLSGDLTSVLGSIDAAILVISSDLRLRRFNQGATGVFNLIPDDIGRPFSHLTHRLELPDLVAICERVNATAQSEEHTTQMGEHTMLLQVTPRLNDDRVDGVVLVVTDISRVAAVQRRAKNAAAALDLASFPVCILAPSGNITDANAAYAEMTQRDVSWIVGQDVRDLSLDAEYEHLSHGLRRAREGHRWSGVLRARKPDGTNFWENVDLIPLPPENGEVPAIIRLSTPVPTDDARDDDSSPDAFFVWRIAADRVNGSPALGPVMGLDTWVGGKLDELLTHVVDHDRARLREKATTAMGSGESFEQPCQVLTKGKAATILVRMQPILHPPSGEAVMVGRCHTEVAP